MNQTQFKGGWYQRRVSFCWFPHITAAMKEFGITTAIDRAMFNCSVRP